jgi:ADP-ribose pyrophosphatase YjhB (NUDIX family)
LGEEVRAKGIEPEELRELERAFGCPEEVEFPEPFVMQDGEFRLLRESMCDGRSHDITLFIFIDGRIVAIRKPFHPPGVYRPPSGGVPPGESIVSTAKREALAETGLEIELERYLLRLKPVFIRGGERVSWTSHVFLARRVGGELKQHDTREIEEVRLVTVAELEGPIQERLKGSGFGGLLYRARLAELTLARLRELGLLPPPLAEGETKAGSGPCPHRPGSPFR